MTTKQYVRVYVETTHVVDGRIVAIAAKVDNDVTDTINKLQKELDDCRDHIENQAISREYLIEAYQNTVENRETTIDELNELNDTQAYVIRNRVHSFAEGVFAKALEAGMCQSST